MSRRYYGRIKFQVFKLWIKLKEIILIPYQELDFFHPTCHTKSESRFFLQLDDWVLCKVYMKGGSNKSEDHEENADVKVLATDNSGVQATTNLPQAI